MFKPLLVFDIVFGSLLVLVPQPMSGFTIKLHGKYKTFSEKNVEAVNKKIKMPVGDDAFPDPNGKGITRENVPTSDELYLDGIKPMTNDEIDAYLIKYGYLLPPVNSSDSENNRRDAIKEFQRFSRLGQSGIVDTATKKRMKKPRCGLADRVPNSKFADFNTAGSGAWGKKHLTYRIASYSTKLPESTIREWTAKAFKMWSDVSQLIFTEVQTGPADLKLSFVSYEHGDYHPFDGPGGDLGHAFFPRSGEIHLDEGENWTVQSETGTNLLFVLIHEIGHALGLRHSSVDKAIMEPVYSGYRSNLTLHKDDIAGIQFLYGKTATESPATEGPTTEILNYPTTQQPEPTTEPTRPTRKFPCPFRFWAAMTDGNRTYGFARSYRYDINPDGKITGRKLISSIFRGGPRVVGAAAYNEVTRQTFLFIGRRVWRFTNHELDKGFPKKLKYFIRAAVVEDEQLIAFSFTHVHYLDQDTMKDYVDGEVTLKDEYPGLPDSIGASVSYNDGLAYILYTRKVVQLDVYTGEVRNEKSCSNE